MNTFFSNPMTKITVFFLIFASIFVFAFPRTSNAQLPLFGGLVAFSFPCACSGTFLLTIIGPKPAVITQSPFIPQYRNFMLPLPGVYTLGYYIPGAAVCYVFVGIGCAAITAQGMVSPQTGTSL